MDGPTTVYDVSRALGVAHYPDLFNVQGDRPYNFYVTKASRADLAKAKHKAAVGHRQIAVKIIVHRSPEEAVRTLEAVNTISTNDFATDCIFTLTGKVRVAGVAFYWIEMATEWLAPFSHARIPPATFSAIDTTIHEAVQWSLCGGRGWFDISLRNMGLNAVGAVQLFDYDDEGHAFGSKECVPMASESSCLLHYLAGTPTVHTPCSYDELTRRLANVQVTNDNCGLVVTMIYAGFLRTLYNAVSPRKWAYASVEDVTESVKLLAVKHGDGAALVDAVQQLFRTSCAHGMLLCTAAFRVFTA
jgi:hypothetical protein